MIAASLKEIVVATLPSCALLRASIGCNHSYYQPSSIGCLHLFPRQETYIRVHQIFIIFLKSYGSVIFLFSSQKNGDM